MPVGRRVGDVDGSDDAARTQPALDHHVLAHELGELRADDTPDEIGRAARRDRQDETQRSLRIAVLRPRAER